MAGFGRIVLVGALVMALAACQAREANDPVVSAVAHNNTATVREYLAGGGDPNLRTRDGDPLVYIASGPRGGVWVARMLLDAGANPNAVSHRGRTALQNASSWCDVEMVNLFVDRGANVSLAGGNGQTPLDAVCEKPANRRLEVIAILQGAGRHGG